MRYAYVTLGQSLDEADKAWLLQCGYLEDDIPQIEEAIKVSSYTLCEKKAPYREIKALTAHEARELLRKEDFLSGIGRSAFHFSATRDCLRGQYIVMFDSSALFKD